MSNDIKISDTEIDNEKSSLQALDETIREFDKKKRQYFGTKLLNAAPMSRAEYNAFRGWSLPNNENGDDEGYIVEYTDGGTQNVEGFVGYVSWSPKDVFERSYHGMMSMTFGHAIEAMKLGNKVSRPSWNGKGMFVVLMPSLNLPPYNTQGTDRKVNDRTAKFIGEDKPLNSQPYFAMLNAQGNWQPGWIPSQSDILANDWLVV